MINFRERLKKEKKIFQNILEKFPAKFVLDAECGSGFHTIILSKLKLKVTGLDNSNDILNFARENFKNYRLKTVLIKGSFLSLNKELINMVI
jgi:tRNA/tmRNA/rRNA uracil-C5-methylase (TrmA/RlmC/RlmD family)